MKISPFSLDFTLGLFCILAFSLQSFGQSTYKASSIDKAKVEVSGTSTLHSWKAVAGNFGWKAAPLQLTEAGATIDSFHFHVAVESLDGGRGAAMNKKIKDAFNAASHPKIEYHQTGVAAVSAIASDGSFTITSKGSLSMAGQTREIELNLAGEKTESGLKISTTKEMKMSDFEIEPPSAMFGQIVCGDDIKVFIELNYESVN